MTWPEPDPVDPPRESFICGHAEEYGRAVVVTDETATSRCGKCGAVLAVLSRVRLCACQRAGSYDPACQGSGYCRERGRK